MSRKHTCKKDEIISIIPKIKYIIMYQCSVYHYLCGHIYQNLIISVHIPQIAEEIQHSMIIT